MGGPVPHIRFDTEEVLPAQRFQLWSGAVNAYEVAQPEGAGPFRAQIDAWMLGGLVVTHNVLSPVRMRRSAAKLRTTPTDHYTFLLLKRGEWTGDVDGRTMTVGPGQIVAFDLSRLFDAGGGNTDSISISISRSAVDEVMPPSVDIHGAMLEGATGRLFTDYLLSLVAQLPTMEQTEAPAVLKVTLGLFSACLLRLEQAESSVPLNSAELRHRIKRYVNRNLASPDLTPARIAHEFGLSRSVLYRAFPGGGIAAHIKTRRLQAAHVLLSDPTETRRIADIAYGFGFVSEAHFSKSFRRRFGYSPREVRFGRADRGVEPRHAAVSQFLEWMKVVG